MRRIGRLDYSVFVVARSSSAIGASPQVTE
jgi:hypothetical protein